MTKRLATIDPAELAPASIAQDVPNPARAYIATIPSASGRLTMQQALGTVAHIIMHGSKPERAGRGEAVHLLSGAEAGKRGSHTGNQHTNGNINNINISKKQETAMGTSTAFTMRRLFVNSASM